MEKKQKNSELNFLYLDEKYINQKSKKGNRAERKSAPKRNTTSKKKKSIKSKNADEGMFDFDNEIVIGVTQIPETKQVNSKSKSTRNKQAKTNKKTAKKKISNTNTKNANKKAVNTKNKKKVKNKRISIVGEIIKWTILLVALIAAFIFFMMSPLFNIVEIKVSNNQKISSETIISLSGIQLGENIYKTSSKTISKNIKQEAYIDNVKISRKLPNVIEISVKERTATYMLEYANSYAYINNQGYILEISEEALQVPIIGGYTTKEEDIKLGNRLNEEDLGKLGTVLKIVESANVNSIGDLITRIDITNKQDYKLILENEKKIIYIGDASNLSNRMIYVKAVIEAESGIEGEIFANGDLNSEKVFFREKI